MNKALVSVQRQKWTLPSSRSAFIISIMALLHVPYIFPIALIGAFERVLMLTEFVFFARLSLRVIA